MVRELKGLGLDVDLIGGQTSREGDVVEEAVEENIEEDEKSDVKKDKDNS